MLLEFLDETSRIFVFHMKHWVAIVIAPAKYPIEIDVSRWNPKEYLSEISATLGAFWVLIAFHQRTARISISWFASSSATRLFGYNKVTICLVAEFSKANWRRKRAPEINFWMLTRLNPSFLYKRLVLLEHKICYGNSLRSTEVLYNTSKAKVTAQK